MSAVVCKSTVLQGANVTGNNIAGLLVSGSADVTLTGSTFDQNNSPEGDGTGPAALAINGSARVQVVQSLFTRNNFDEHGQNGGAVLCGGCSQCFLSSCRTSSRFNQCSTLIILTQNLCLQVPLL